MAKQKKKVVKKEKEHVQPAERLEPSRTFLGEVFHEGVCCRCELEFVLKLRNAGRRVKRSTRYN